jgi:uncharacterized membrane protein YhaH (DUF805 family)
VTKDIDRKGWLQLVAFVATIAAIAVGVVILVLIWLL